MLDEGLEVIVIDFADVAAPRGLIGLQGWLWQGQGLRS